MPTTSQVQSLVVQAAGGKYKLSIGGALVETLNYSDGKATLLLALQRLYNFDDIDVTEQRTNADVTFTITFTRDHAGHNYAPLQWAETRDATELVAGPGASVDVKLAVLHDGTTAPQRTSIQTLTVNATAGSYVLHFLRPNDVGVILDAATAPIAYNATEAQVLAAISAVLNPNNTNPSKPFTDNVAVEKHGNAYVIVFQGEYRNASIAYVDQTTNHLAGTAIATSQRFGLQYYAVETLNVTLGDFADTVDVRGTSATTNLHTAGGDDFVNVTSLFNDLSAFGGTLNIDAGTGHDHQALHHQRRGVRPEPPGHADHDQLRDRGSPRRRRRRRRRAVHPRPGRARPLVQGGPGRRLRRRRHDLHRLRRRRHHDRRRPLPRRRPHGHDAEHRASVTTRSSSSSPRTRSRRSSSTRRARSRTCSSWRPRCSPATTTRRPTGSPSSSTARRLPRASSSSTRRSTTSACSTARRSTRRRPWRSARRRPSSSRSTRPGIMHLATDVKAGDVVTVELNGVDLAAFALDLLADTVSITGADAGALVLVRIVKLTTETFLLPKASKPDNDLVDAHTSTMPLVIFGGQGQDDITGGKGGDIIFGDRGRVLWFTPGTVIPPGATLAQLMSLAVRVAGTGGTGDKTDGLEHLVGYVISVDPTIGDTDHINVPLGNDIVLAGAGSDFITVGAGTNLLFGDSGFVDFFTVDRDATDIDTAGSIAPEIGGDDQITTGTGDNLVIGGAGGDTFTGGTGFNVILGDSGTITAALVDGEEFHNLPITLGTIQTTADDDRRQRHDLDPERQRRRARRRGRRHHHARHGPEHRPRRRRRGRLRARRRHERHRPGRLHEPDDRCSAHTRHTSFREATE